MNFENYYFEREDFKKGNKIILLIDKIKKFFKQHKDNVVGFGYKGREGWVLSIEKDIDSRYKNLYFYFTILDKNTKIQLPGSFMKTDKEEYVL